MLHTYIDSSEPLNRYIAPHNQCLLQYREHTVEP